MEQQVGVPTVVVVFPSFFLIATTNAAVKVSSILEPQVIPAMLMPKGK